MYKYWLLSAGLLSFLFGCNSGTPYHKKNGKWYYDEYLVNENNPGKFVPLNKRFAKSPSAAFYRGQAIFESDGQSFEALSDHYGKDKNKVYYCDTYRKEQEYFMTKYNRIISIPGADPATFKYLSYVYAKDKANVYEEGKPYPVKDANSFELLDNGFAKDSVRGYYHFAEIPGTHGSTFNMLDAHFSKDRKNVYYSFMKQEEEGIESLPVTHVLPSALPDSFQVLNGDYAKDEQRVYYKHKLLAANSINFKALAYGYANDQQQVFYRGKPLAGADAKSFITVENSMDSTDAKDSRFFYFEGRKKE